MFDTKNSYHHDVEYQKMEDFVPTREPDDDDEDAISTPGVMADQSAETDGRTLKGKHTHEECHQCNKASQQVINLHIHMSPKDFLPGEAPTLIDEDNPRFRCCCHKIHVTRGAFLIGLVELVFAGFNLVDAIRNAAQGVVVQSLIEILFAIVFVVVVLLMIWGVRKERKAFLVPHLVWSVVFSVIAVTLAIIVLATWFFAAAHLAWALIPNQNIGPTSNWKTMVANGTMVEDYDFVEEPRPTDPPEDTDYFVTNRPEAKKLSQTSQLKLGLKDESHRAKYDEVKLHKDEAAPKASQVKQSKKGGVKKEEEESEPEDEPLTKDTPISTFLWAVVLIIMAVLIITVVLQIWFFITLRACYLYLKAKETNLDRAEMAVLKPLREAIEEAHENT